VVQQPQRQLLQMNINLQHGHAKTMIHTLVCVNVVNMSSRKIVTVALQIAKTVQYAPFATKNMQTPLDTLGVVGLTMAMADTYAFAQ
jgi:hypothetical protein